MRSLVNCFCYDTSKYRERNRFARVTKYSDCSHTTQLQPPRNKFVIHKTREANSSAFKCKVKWYIKILFLFRTECMYCIRRLIAGLQLIRYIYSSSLCSFRNYFRKIQRFSWESRKRSTCNFISTTSKLSLRFKNSWHHSSRVIILACLPSLLNDKCEKYIYIYIYIAYN